MRTCTTCGAEKPLSEFAKDASKKDGVRGRCLACQRSYWNEWRSRPGNAEKVSAATKRSNRKHAASRKAYARKRNYGLTPPEFDSMLIEQANACAICSTPIDQDACVDHDHLTEAVRGLLCRKCNTGLGMFSDDVAALQSAARYLETHKKEALHVA